MGKPLLKNDDCIWFHILACMSCIPWASQFLYAGDQCEDPIFLQALRRVQESNATHREQLDAVDQNWE